MKVKALVIAAAIEEIAPGTIQESWDNSGFVIGGPQKDVSSALLALDCTPELIEEAVQKGADMIITHHPLIFSPLKRITGTNPVEKMVERAIKEGIVIYSAHTNADKIPQGVSGLMAERLLLRDVEILDKDDEATGMGVVGNLEEAMDAMQFIEYVKRRYSLNSVRCSKPIEVPIERVALCGGSGGYLIEKSMDAGAQALITGDVSYHKFLCDRDFMVLDIGHFESENEVLILLKEILLKKIPNFEVCIAESNNNLIYYY